MSFYKRFNNINDIYKSIESDYNDFVIITDQNVYDLYLKDDTDHRIIVINPGEDNKNLDTVSFIYDVLSDFGINKNTLLVGMGGGIVTDITGFVASTYLRGLKFGFISTTILSTVDASIGGKNGVNFNNYKNYIGTINEPEFMYWSLNFFSTLDNENFISGFGEILKYAIGFDKDLFEVLDRNDYNTLDSTTMNWIIERCIEIKNKIVYNDPYETNRLRTKLNLGHTIAHAIEKYTHTIIHGKAVGIGLYMIMRFVLSEKKAKYDDLSKAFLLLQKYKVFNLSSYNMKELIGNSIQYINADKKSVSNTEIDIVIPTKIGNCEVIKYNKEEFIKKLSEIEFEFKI